MLVLFFYLRDSAKEVMFSSLATLCKNFRTDLHEIVREGWQWSSE